MRDDKYVRLTSRVSPTNGTDSHKRADPTNGPKSSNGPIHSLDVRDVTSVTKHVDDVLPTYEHRRKQSRFPLIDSGPQRWQTGILTSALFVSKKVEVLDTLIIVFQNQCICFSLSLFNWVLWSKIVHSF